VIILIPAQLREQAGWRESRAKAQRAAQTFAMSLAVWLTAETLCNAEVLRAGRMVLDVPDGGMTLVGPPESLSEFKHRLYDVTLTTEVASASNYGYWQRACMPSKNVPETAAAYQVGVLARADPNVYYKIAKSSKHGISTPTGSWLEHCLVFRSGELSAKVTVDLPKSGEKAGLDEAKINKILVSARLAPASVEEGGASDPRIALEELEDFMPSGLPTFTFRFEHNRLPFSINIALSDPMSYDRAKMLNVVSARVWKIGQLARADEYFYYFVWPDATPDFQLGFRAPGITARVEVGVSKASIDKGEIGIPEIERILASARITSSSKSQ